MFLVPGTIVAVIVGGLLLFMWGCGGPHTPAQFLKALDDPNEEVRWRTASDLAQVLLRDKELASDADFALQIAIRLDNAVKDNEDAEKRLAERLAKSTLPPAEEWKNIKRDGEWKKIEERRNFITYLMGCSGNFTVPVGVPVLRKLAEQDSGLEPRGLAQRRWGALWALALQGEKLSKDYVALPDIKKDLIRRQLEKAAERNDHVAWVQPALDNLNKRRDDQTPDVLGVDRTARICIGPGSDPFMRQLVALGLNFWVGTPEENARIDDILVDLTHDTGAGGELLDELRAENPKGIVPAGKVTDLEVQFQAHRALAYRGSDRIDLAMLGKMLDEGFLRENLKIREKQAEARTSESAVTQTLIDTLKAVGHLHAKRPDMDLSSLRPAVDKLADSNNKAVASEAKELQSKW
jgi:hypothetical protein